MSFVAGQKIKQMNGCYFGVILVLFVRKCVFIEKLHIIDGILVLPAVSTGQSEQKIELRKAD